MTRAYETIAARGGRFLAALRAGRNVCAASRLAGLDRSTVYKARKRDPAFAGAWALALAESRERRRAQALRLLAEGRTAAVAYRDAGLGRGVVFRARKREPAFARAWAAAAASARRTRRRARERRLRGLLGLLEAGLGGAEVSRRSGLPLAILKQSRRRDPGFAQAWQAAVACGEAARERRWRRRLAQRRRRRAARGDGPAAYVARLNNGLLAAMLAGSRKSEVGSRREREGAWR